MTGRQQEEVTTGVSLTCRLCLVDLLPTHDLVYQSNGSMATNTTGHCLCKTGGRTDKQSRQRNRPYSQLLTGEEVDRMDGPGTGCSNTQHSRPEIHNKKPTSHNNYKQTE